MLLKALAAIVAALLTATVSRAVFQRWPKAGKWAIETTPPVCPNCKTPPPAVRMPTDINELLWGGHTCHRCGTEYNKQGEERIRNR